MLTPELIVNEVKKEFGDDAVVHVNYGIDIDGYFINVTKRTSYGVLRMEHCISGLEELQAHDPSDMLKFHIAEMHKAFKQEQKRKEDENASLCDERRKIGREDDSDGW